MTFKLYVLLLFCTNIGSIRCYDCYETNETKVTTLYNSQFVNVSGNFKMDIDTFIRSYEYEYFYDYFNRQEIYRAASRRMIAYIISGYIRILDELYENRITLERHGDGLTVTIGDINRKDAGVYLVPGPFSRGLCFKLYVLDYPTKPVLLPPVTDHSLIEGQPARFICDSNSTTIPRDHNLSLEYRWEEDGQKIENDDHFIVNGTVLEILSVDRNDSLRNLTCRVQETNGLSSSTTFSPSVIWGPVKPPEAVYLLQSGDTVPKVFCIADCSPACSFEWRKVGSDSKISSTAQLELDQRADLAVGEYVCTAKGRNKTGFRSVTIHFQHKTGSLIKAEKKDEVVVVETVLGILLLISVVITGIVSILLCRSGKRSKNKEEDTHETGNEELQMTREEQGSAYEELDSQPRNQHIYETARKSTFESAERGATNSDVRVQDQSDLYEN